MARFYVYAWFYPEGNPCYIGKGCGDRWTRAEKSHNKQLAGIFRASGGTLPIVIIRSGLTEPEAFELETALISILGRADKGLGRLVNHADGGEGISGRIDTDEQKLRRGLAISKGKTGKPNFRARGLKRTEEQRRRISLGTQKAMAALDDDAKTRMANALLTPEAVENRRQVAKRNAQDPVYRQSLLKRLRREDGTLYAIGYKHSPDSIERSASKRRGQKRSDKTCALMHAAQQGRRWWTTPDGVVYRSVLPRSEADVIGRIFR